MRRPERLALWLSAAFIAVGAANAAIAQAGAPDTVAPSQPLDPQKSASQAMPTSPAAGSTVADEAASPEASLDLDGLKEQLTDTKAIGLFTKLSLKNQMDDLLAQFRDYYDGNANITLSQLHRSYDLLLMKVLSLIQDSDQPLARSIIESREAIWDLLADPVTFTALEG